MNDIMRMPLLVFATLLIGCSANYNAKMGANSVEKPPFPRTKSILPLALGNRWVFSYTEYDSLGRIINPGGKAVDLHLSISGGYGLIDDSTLVPVNFDNYRDTFPTYVYQFEWEEKDSGILVVYRDLYSLQTPPERGLYIIGKYENGNPRLYPSEKLWLAYPADSGKTWQYNLDSAGDSSKTSYMELISTKGRFYFPDANSMTALTFCDCCVYKETNGNSVYYYYYNEHIGQVGYLEYVNGTLRVTYLLKSYSLAPEYSYD